MWLRAIPWTHLLLRRRETPTDFSLSWRHRLSVPSAALCLLGLIGAPFSGYGILFGLVALAVFIVNNLPFFGFLRRHRGGKFAIEAIPLHLLFNGYSALGAVIGIVTYPWAGTGPGRVK